MTGLKLDPRNARRHSDRNKRQIKQSLETVGAGRSILADADGIVRAGNGVFAEWGDKPVKIVETDGKELVVVQRTDLRGQDAIRAAALDNLVADSSAFDYDAAILAEMARDDDVIRAIANEDAKLRELLRKENGTGEKQDPGELIDKAAQLQEKWQVQRGDVWQIGKHRLMCGDSTNKEDVERLMDGKRAQLMIADPPYNVGYEYESNDDNKPRDEYGKWCLLWLRLGQSISDMQIVTPGKTNERLYEPMEWLTWFKRFGTSRGHCFKAMVTEPILLFGEKPKSRFYPTDHFDYPTDRIEGLRELHTCPKPIGLWLSLIVPMTDDGSVIYDPFLGSGTTIVACEQTGRIGYGMEISEKYCAVSLERLANLGLQPQRIQIAG